jgi:L-alanine-DL-glutamate epimerase-like enolase superfamily enzyme
LDAGAGETLPTAQSLIVRTTEAKIIESKVRVYRVPTDAQEADGTYEWTSTTMVLVEVKAGDQTGLGYTYADEATGELAKTLLEKVVHGRDAFSHAQIWFALLRHVRNLGDEGITQMAIAAIDNALWDLRAKLAGLPLVHLLGAVRSGIAVYGSGGFTSYDDRQLSDQLGGWARDGFFMVKMKVGAHPDDDPRRVQVAREAIGERVELFVDANGAYTVSQALRLAEEFGGEGVCWFEEPVSSNNLAGLRQIRERAPAGMDVAAGEYGYTAWYFRRMIDEGAVTVLQADATRCAGITGFLNAGALCWATDLPLSSHCGPSAHLHVCCATARVVHMEFFHDHARIERLFFDGFREPKQGIMTPDLSRPGMGLTLKEQDAARYLVS